VANRIQTEIDIAVKGSAEVKKISKALDNLYGEITQVNNKTGEFVKNFSNLNNILSLVKKNFDNAASGTLQQEKAARLLLVAERQLNKEYQQREALLQKLRTAPMPLPGTGVGRDPVASSIQRRRKKLSRGSNQYSSPIGPFQASGMLGGQSSPVDQKIQRTLNLKRDEVRLQEALLSLEQRSAAKQNEKLQIQGELNRKTAEAVNNAKLRGQFSPLTSGIRDNIGDIKSRRTANILSERRNQFGNVNPGAGGFRGFSARADEIQKLTQAEIALSASRRLASEKIKSLASIERRRAKTESFGANFRRFRRNRPRDRGVRQQVFQSAAIGGGFPLLFGGGPLQAAAGALGGGIGGMFGKGGGFAGSIAATALTQQFQAFVDGARKVGEAMNENAKEFDRVQNIVGKEGANKLSAFATQTKTLTKTFGDFILSLQSGVVGLLNMGGVLNGLIAMMQRDVARRQAARSDEFKTRTKGLRSQGGQGIKKRNILAEETDRQFDLNVQNFANQQAEISEQLLNKELQGLERKLILADAETEKMREALELRFKTVDIINRLEAGGVEVTDELRDRISLLVEQNNELDKSIAKGKEFAEQVLKPQMDALARKEQEEFDAGAAIGKRLAPEIEMFNTLEKEVQSMELISQLENAKTIEQKVQLQLKLAELKLGYEISDLNKKDIEDLIRKKEEQLENNKAIAEEKALRQQIEGILAGGMTNAVMGLIEGTRTLGESLASIAKQLASMFLNKAFSKIFSFAEQGAYYRSGGFKAFQQGGVVNSPTLGMIGEGGEPEYVIPASKMSGAMSRYSAGARGGSVIPGGSGDSGTVAGSSGNTVVEYTGPTLNFNGDEYVPKSAVPEIIGAATKQGAMAGKAQVLGTLRNSRSQRASLGL
jgi:hypothetical protein